MEDYYKRKLHKYKDRYNALLLELQKAGNDDNEDDNDDDNEDDKRTKKEKQIDENITTFMAVPPLS